MNVIFDRQRHLLITIELLGVAKFRYTILKQEIKRIKDDDSWSTLLSRSIMKD